jgi:hypothetical protein
LRVRPEPTLEKHLLAYSRQGRLFALPANIRPYWQNLSGTNTQAYYEISKLRTDKVLEHWAQDPVGFQLLKKVFGRHDIQHIDIQHNRIQHHDIEHYNK